MSSLEGSFWIRKKDGVPFEVVADPMPVGSHRSIRLRNCHTKRDHWATPEGLGRKYRLEFKPEGAA
ncbi:hypothetical protein [Gordonia amicalis]|uniref:hypothetical protein n=1 Tax=Gordonia amicalis TaxID=89053 RepID=UPI0024BA11FF|nr:hypothetical protein [Gordonia amicalis]MDJ0454379.1 hypothetical protein [Gordonia amicalis]MDV7077732.1 hypothetical protein [Gordonia amicalis]